LNIETYQRLKLFILTSCIGLSWLLSLIEYALHRSIIAYYNVSYHVIGGIN